MEKELCKCLRCGKPVEDVEYIRYGGYHCLCHHALQTIAKERQYEQDKQKYRFIPGYYEWVLADEKGKRLYCIPDADEMCVTDDGETCALDEVRNNVESDLKTEEQLCSNGEENVHLLVGLDELPKSAVEIMARALYDYYCLAYYDQGQCITAKDRCQENVSRSLCLLQSTKSNFL